MTVVEGLCLRSWWCKNEGEILIVGASDRFSHGKTSVYGKNSEHLTAIFQHDTIIRMEKTWIDI
jgi:predicted TPR repeat methyltransferase